MTKSEIIETVKHALHSKKDLFELQTQTLLHSPPTESSYEVDGKKFITFDYPKTIQMDTVDGYKLKDDKGYIAIRETYQYSNPRDFTKIAHVYRYVSSEINYKCSYKDNTYPHADIPYYSFHFDSDLLYPDSTDNSHPPHHLQVVHLHPRFPIGELGVEDFLLRVKYTCYKDDNLTPFSEPIYMIS